MEAPSALTDEGDVSASVGSGHRDRILLSALHEFSDKGFAGARIRSIADGAGTNVRMIYHYFGSKEGLYKAVFHEVFEQRATAMANPGSSFADVLAVYADAFSSSVERLRMLQWEALDVGAGAAGELVLEEARREALAQRVDHIVGIQQTRPALADLDSDLLYAALTALAVFPLSFPGTTRMITGQDPTTEDFRQRYRAFLRKFGQLIDSIVRQAPDRERATSRRPS